MPTNGSSFLLIYMGTKDTSRGRQTLQGRRSHNKGLPGELKGLKVEMNDWPKRAGPPAGMAGKIGLARGGFLPNQKGGRAQGRAGHEELGCMAMEAVQGKEEPGEQQEPQKTGASPISTKEAGPRPGQSRAATGIRAKEMCLTGIQKQSWVGS